MEDLGVLDELLGAAQQESAREDDDREDSEAFDDALDDTGDGLANRVHEREATLGVLDDLLDAVQRDTDEQSRVGSDNDDAVDSGERSGKNTADNDDTTGAEGSREGDRDAASSNASGTDSVDDSDAGLGPRDQDATELPAHAATANGAAETADISLTDSENGSSYDVECEAPVIAEDSTVAEEGASNANDIDAPIHDEELEAVEDEAHSAWIGADEGPGDSDSCRPPPIADSTQDETSDSVLGFASAGDEQLQDPVEAEEIPAPMREDPEFPVLPPPAPTGPAVVVGSMIPATTDENDDEDFDSQDDEEEEDHRELPPPLDLGNGSDDDDDELEVDPVVVDTIEVTKESAIPVKAPTLDGARSQSDEPALLAALPTAKPTASTDEIDFSFADEVRAAHVVVPPSSVEGPSKRVKDLGPQSNSAESAFGISYTSLRKKREEVDSAERDEYSLPSAAAFPDEREFESELNLSSDVSFSVKSKTPSTTLVGAVDDDDDEFGFVAPATVDAAVEEVSPQLLEARRASLQARRTQDEGHIIEELKKATDKEKSLNETGQQHSSAAAAVSATTAPTISQNIESGNALTMRELHGIYKRGLGDQGALLDENEVNDDRHNKAHHAAASNNSANSAPLSVMGRILSKPSVIAEVITEEENEEDDEEKGGSGVAAGMKSVAATNSAGENGSNDNSDGVEEWREIQLTHHAPGKDTALRTEVGEVSVQDDQHTREPRASKPVANFKISFQEAFDYCLQADEFLHQRDKIVSEDFGETGRSCFACFSPRPRLLFPNALDERDRIFCIAATSYDAVSDVFSRVLQTLYVKLTRTQREVPLSGSHWEDIGFQGSNPATDLRGCGVLSLLQMLYLVEKHSELALRFHSLSQHPTRHFPLACTLINVTLQCVTALRSGALYRECNKQTSVFKAVNTFYVALASMLMDEIQSSSAEIPVVMREVLQDGRANPERVLEQFAKSGLREAGAQAPVSPRKSTGAREASPNIDFTEIALQSHPGGEEDE